MKVAVIIPVYNAARTVAETIGSLQDIDRGWEHVTQMALCDDASTDNSFEVITRSRFDRCPIRIYSHDINRGESAAYATMVRSLSVDTEWFLILHADDLALPNFLTRNLEIVKSCDETVAAVCSNYWMWNQDTERLAAAENDVLLFRAGTVENLRHTAKVGCWWHISGALVNKRKWNEFGGRDAGFPYLGDWDLTLRWQAHGYSVGYSGVATTKYRELVNNSISSVAYVQCQDLKERAQIALSFPEVFSRTICARLAFAIFTNAARRFAKFVLLRRTSFAISALSVGAQCFWQLLFRRESDLSALDRRTS